MAKFAGALFAVLCFCNVQSWTVEASLLDGTMQQATDAIQNANSTMQKLQDQAQSALSNVTALANDAKSQALARANCTDDADAAVDTVTDDLQVNITKALQTVNNTSNSIITQSNAIQEETSNASWLSDIYFAMVQKILATIGRPISRLKTMQPQLVYTTNFAQSRLHQLRAEYDLT